MKNNTLVSDEHKIYVNDHNKKVVNDIYSITSQFNLTTKDAFNQLISNDFNLKETIKNLKKKENKKGISEAGDIAETSEDTTDATKTKNKAEKNSSSKKTLESLFSFGNKVSGTMLVEQLKNTMNITSSNNNNIVERLKNAFTNTGIDYSKSKSVSSKGGGSFGNVEKIIKKNVSIGEINIENLVRANNSLGKLHGTIKKDQSMIKKERLDAATSIQYLISLFALGKKNEKNQLEKYYRDTKKKDSLKDVISELLQYLSITRNEIPDMQ